MCIHSFTHLLIFDKVKEMKNTVRLNFDFPKNEYPYLKLLCAKKGLSFKEFTTELLLKAIEEYEDHRLAKKARKRLKEIDEKAQKLAGRNEE
jgi:predicted DNA-binding protein